MKTGIVALTIVALMVPGCLDPSGPASQTASDVVSTATSASQNLTNPTPTALLYVGAVRNYYDPGTGLTHRGLYQFGYATPYRHTVEEVSISVAGEITTAQVKTAYPVALIAPPLPITYSPTSLSALDAMLDDLTALLPSSPAAGTTTTYALTGMAGSPSWLVTSTAPSSKIIVNATSLSATPMTATTPAAGTIAINAPDFGAHSAMGPATTDCQAWHADSILVAILGTERYLPGVYELPFTTITTPASLFLPDYAFGDGKATAWAFLCYSPSAHKELPVIVYASLIAIRGAELTPRYPASSYTDLSQYGSFIDSTAAVTAIPSGELRDFTMVLETAAPRGGTWVFHQAPPSKEAHAVKFLINAKTGALEGCTPNTAC